MSGRTIADISEDEIIKRFFEPITDGLGDDVARIMLSGDRELLISTDALIEDVHFLRRCPAHMIGEKAVRVNASDIVASGGAPRWFTLSVSLPPELELSWLSDFAEGIQRPMQEIGIHLIGGDTTRSPKHIAINITVFGTVGRGKSVPRSGARIGDWIGVTGNLGESLPGLEMLLGKRKLDREQAQHWLIRHFCPPYRGPFAQDVATRVSAMMDLSDGLAVDLPRLLQASELRGEVDLGRLPRSAEAVQIGVTPEEALSGGEDYELLFTVPQKRWHEIENIGNKHGVKVTQIGTVHEGKGLRYTFQGRPINPRPASYKHFA